MATPTKGAQSSETQLEVDWVALTSTADTGDSSILSYHLQWDSGSSGATFTDLVGYPSNSLVLTYLVSSGVSSGNTYQFRVRAKNLYGWGAYSTVLSLKASSVPDQPSAVSTAKDGLNVRISWTAPADNSETITAYQILIVKSDASQLEDTVNCDGSQAGIISNLYCDVPYDTLRTTYGLVYGDLVQAVVRA